MSYWNYRVVKHDRDPFRSEVYYAIHEVHYEDDGTPTGMSKEPTTFQAETVDGLLETIEERVMLAFTREVFIPPERWK